MRIPGFCAHHAIGAASGYRGAPLSPRIADVSPALRVSPGSADPIAFWACFRNCYDRCVGESGLCFGDCYGICDANPNVWFLR